jgi:hypothetical protein
MRFDPSYRDGADWNSNPVTPGPKAPNIEMPQVPCSLEAPDL